MVKQAKEIPDLNAGSATNMAGSSVKMTIGAKVTSADAITRTSARFARRRPWRWFGDPEGHSQASRRGWRHRG
jgi:hypothetical protein